MGPWELSRALTLEDPYVRGALARLQEELGGFLRGEVHEGVARDRDMAAGPPDGVEDRRRTDGGAVEIGGVVLPRPRPSWRRSSRVARRRVTQSQHGLLVSQQIRNRRAQQQSSRGAMGQGCAVAQKLRVGQQWCLVVAETHQLQWW